MGLKKYFSERHGYKALKVDFQLEGMDNDLRTAIWNMMVAVFLNSRPHNDLISDSDHLGHMLITLWTLYFKKPIDEYSRHWSEWVQFLKQYIFSCEWHEVYEILELIIDNWPNTYQVENIFIPAFNKALERELSGYRVIGGFVTPITDEVEIAEIEEALNITPIIRPVRVQLEDALKKMSDRQNPDYRGSIKDSISALETLCRIITGESKLELGKALKVLEERVDISIHGALLEGFSKLYGWTSDDQGIRHALMDEPNLTFHDAKYMLVSCSAFTNYLVAKAAEAGIDFQR